MKKVVIEQELFSRDSFDYYDDETVIQRFVFETGYYDVNYILNPNFPTKEKYYSLDLNCFGDEINFTFFKSYDLRKHLIIDKDTFLYLTNVNHKEGLSFNKFSIGRNDITYRSVTFREGNAKISLLVQIDQMKYQEPLNVIVCLTINNSGVLVLGDKDLQKFKHLKQLSEFFYYYRMLYCNFSHMNKNMLDCAKTFFSKDFDSILGILYQNDFIRIRYVNPVRFVEYFHENEYSIYDYDYNGKLTEEEIFYKDIKIGNLNGDKFLNMSKNNKLKQLNNFIVFFHKGNICCQGIIVKTDIVGEIYIPYHTFEYSTYKQLYNPNINKEFANVIDEVHTIMKLGDYTFEEAFEDCCTDIKPLK